MKIKTNKNVIIYEEEEEMIIINIMENSFYSLDHVGTIIWKEIAKHQELEPILTSLIKIFGISKDKIRKDVLEFINELKKVGVIELND